MHIEFVADDSVIARTDTLGTATAIAGGQSGFEAVSTVHKIGPDDLGGSISSVNLLRFVIVAVQPEGISSESELGGAIVDDVTAKIER